MTECGRTEQHEQVVSEGRAARVLGGGLGWWLKQYYLECVPSLIAGREQLGQPAWYAAQSWHRIG